MFRALLLVVAVVSGLAAGLLLTLSPHIDYGSFATSCPGIIVASETDVTEAPGTGGDVPAGIEIVRGRDAFDRQEATERNTGVQGDDRVGRRLASDCADRRFTWSLGAGAAGLLCVAAGSGLLMHTRERRESRELELSAR
ncbi:MAG: hypothetical protein ABWX84_11830 [Nocardioides sp.]